MNVGGERFADVSRSSGLDFSDDGRAIAVCDWDRDGDLDIWLRNRTAPRLRLMESSAAASGRSVMLKLEGVACNRDAIGALVEVELADGSPLVRSVRAGEMFLSQSSKWLHFGLGAEGKIAGVSVRWPAGASEPFRGVGGEGRFVLRQGRGTATAWDGPDAIRLAAAGAQTPLSQAARGRVVLPTAVPIPAIRYRDQAAKPRVLKPTGSGQLLLVWESGCTVCAEQLKAHGDSAVTLDVVALAIDGIETAGAAYEMIENSGLGADWGFIEPASLESVWRWGAALFDRIPDQEVPLGLLLDGGGRCVAIYRGAVDPEMVAADANRLIGIDATARWHLASPLRGTWFTNPVPESFVRQLLGE